MANFVYRPRGFSGYKSGKSMDQIKTDMGLVECPKHLGRYYDPKKYDGCYLCHFKAEREQAH
jgi:hypothetical protein